MKCWQVRMVLQDFYQCKTAVSALESMILADQSQ